MTARIVLPLSDLLGTLRESLRGSVRSRGLLLVRPDPPSAAVPGVRALEGVDLDDALCELARNAAQAVYLLAASGAPPRPLTSLSEVDRELALRAFGRGFAFGADATCDPGRVVVNAAHHTHSLCGFEAGRAALHAAQASYRREVLDPAAVARGPAPEPIATAGITGPCYACGDPAVTWVDGPDGRTVGCCSERCREEIAAIVASKARS